MNRRYLLKKYIFAFILWFSISLYFVHKAYAAQVSFDIRPSLFEIVSQPGKTIPISIELVNKSDHAFFGINIFSLEKNNVLLPYSIINSPIKLILNQSDDSAIFVQKFEKKKVNFNLIIDPLSPKKDYYFVIDVYQINKSSISNQRNIMIDASIQIPILLTVSDDGSSQEIILVHNCEFPSKNYIDNLVYQYFGVIDSNANPSFECLIENKGMNRLFLDTTIEYSNKLGQKGKSIIPKSLLLSKNLYKLSRSSLTNIDDSYAIPLKLNHWMIGKYKVDVIFKNPISDKKWTKEVSFMAIPYKLGALLCFLIFLAKKLNKRKRK